MYIKNPGDIERRSFEIIGESMGNHNFTEEELCIVKRTIHTTGDYDYKNIVRFKGDAINTGMEIIKGGCKIVTDTRMAYSGINKSALKKSGSSINCYIDNDEVLKVSREKGITRSMAAVDMAVSNGAEVFVIGNAPTALFRLGELIEQNIVSPRLIIGVPVGFVGAEESKEYIRGVDIPSITTWGTKGGSNVAASIVNALLYMAVGR